MPELTNRAVEMAEGVGKAGVFWGVGGAGTGAVVDDEEGDEDEEEDDGDDEEEEGEDMIFRTRNRIVACCARTLSSESSR